MVWNSSLASLGQHSSTILLPMEIKWLKHTDACAPQTLGVWPLAHASDVSRSLPPWLSNPAETGGVQLTHSLPPSVGLAVCLSITHRWMSFMVAGCISASLTSSTPEMSFQPQSGGRWCWMGEDLHTVLGSLHHTGVVELLMVTLRLANNAISLLCTNACPPETPLTMAMFQSKHILSQPHQFGFYS